MKIETENAIKILSGKVDENIEPDAALKYTQAALNLTHVLATLNSMKK